jgi:16S rRNA (guanine1207-N2)-methyltransferase
LTLALETGDLVLPENGPLSVLLPTPEVELQGLPQARVQVVQPFRPHFDHFLRAEFECVTQADAPCVAALICLPRAKAQARAMVYNACLQSSGLVIVDGNKTDGIDSIYKDVRKRVDVRGQLTKAHGRIFWFDADVDTFTDWKAPQEQLADGFHTVPGVFSADAIDPASQMLIDNLPGRLGRNVADIGAGWGFLAARILARDAKIESLDLIEADKTALGCAQRNIDDPRAQYHWADALDWKAQGPIDTVVMNPPFHTGRAADPALGRGFIATAARLLTSSGTLWMVANRHLPYEATLSEKFADIREISGDNRFKVLRAARPLRGRSVARVEGGRPTRSRRPRT